MSEEEALALIAEIPGVAERHREGAKSIGGIDLDYRAESIPKLDEMIKVARAANSDTLAGSAGLRSGAPETLEGPDAKRQVGGSSFLAHPRD